MVVLFAFVRVDGLLVPIKLDVVLVGSGSQHIPPGGNLQGRAVLCQETGCCEPKTINTCLRAGSEVGGFATSQIPREASRVVMGRQCHDDPFFVTR